MHTQEHNGVTPGLLTIGRAFNLCYSTVRGHVAELAMEGKLRLEDRQIIVEDSEWIPPPHYEKISMSYVSCLKESAELTLLG